ncbi:hypothetical protein OnM2_06133 [Erysiphe neolycopersici]|uniref:Uncharacterized protein n=1 Tax=Erysiphe neolycopersici TaxID=212602 RepID=A0A420I2V3_9PEZI|nr:hypothetical protein OnM2_06133 [Erysiphe neolycopersici]
MQWAFHRFLLHPCRLFDLDSTMLRAINPPHAGGWLHVHLRLACLDENTKKKTTLRRNRKSVDQTN